jgi:hypothetical protein
MDDIASWVNAPNRTKGMILSTQLDISDTAPSDKIVRCMIVTLAILGLHFVECTVRLPL